MSLPYDLDEHLDNVDAAMFTGDAFMSRKNIAELERHMDRWRKQLLKNKLFILEAELEEMGNESNAP